MENEEIKTDDRPEFLKKRVLVPSITAIIFLICGIFYSIHSIFYKSTDDAFVEGHIITVAPRVSGPVIELYIDDNQEVKKGDLLLKIDPEDYEVKLKQTQAKLEEAKAQFKNSQNKISKFDADVQDAGHEISAAQSKLNFAKNDYDRYSKMFEKGISSKQDYDLSRNNLNVANSNYESYIAKEKSASSALNSAKAQSEEITAFIKRLEAEVAQDKLNLSYTSVYASEDGRITNRSVEKGNYVQTAQPMFSIVPQKMWIVANFKETQIANMKKGQPVKIKVDTYGRKKFKGEVDSIQRATGAKASLFPPENAVGSYVKIVQRVPVKIVFTEDVANYNIVPGMSVVPEVKVK